MRSDENLFGGNVGGPNPAFGFHAAAFPFLPFCRRKDRFVAAAVEMKRRIPLGIQNLLALGGKADILLPSGNGIRRFAAGAEQHSVPKGFQPLLRRQVWENEIRPRLAGQTGQSQAAARRFLTKRIAYVFDSGSPLSHLRRGNARKGR